MRLLEKNFQHFFDFNFAEFKLNYKLCSLYPTNMDVFCFENNLTLSILKFIQHEYIRLYVYTSLHNIKHRKYN